MSPFDFVGYGMGKWWTVSPGGFANCIGLHFSVLEDGLEGSCWLHSWKDQDIYWERARELRRLDLSRRSCEKPTKADGSLCSLLLLWKK